MSEEEKKSEESIEKVDELDRLEYKSTKEKLLALLNGFFIGLAIIVPGVSGSTISIIFKLYDKMMLALSSIFKKFKRAVFFLLPLLIGAVVGFVGGFFAVQSVIDKYTFICISLFAGLMLGGASEVSSEIKETEEHKRGVKEYILLVLGFILPLVLSVTFIFIKDIASLEAAFNMESFPFYLYVVCLLLGIVVSLTQIVPGLSATTLLMCFGAFLPLVNSVSLTVWQANPLWLLIYVMLGIGFIGGILGFSKVINHFISKYRFSTFHLLTGMAYGSVISIFCNTETIGIYQNYAQGLGNMALDLGLGIPLFILGFLGSFFLVYYGKKHQKSKEGSLKEENK